MDDRISDLLGIIREESTLYRDLVEHERRKTALLVQGSADAILESNKTEDAFSSRIRNLGLERARLSQMLGQALRIPREELTLIKLAEKAPPAVALELKKHADSLRNLARQLKSVSRRNRKLIEKSLQFSNGMMGILCSASGSYRQNGLFEHVPSIVPTFSQRA